jgi:putative DNA primase/helicase
VVTAADPKNSGEGFFIYDETQPHAAQRSAEQLGQAKPKLAPKVVAPSPIGIDMSAPYEVARRFLVVRHRLGRIPTLRWWRGEWRKWVGTHYAETEEDALRAEVYEFLSQANGGKFDPGPKHVNAAIDAIKARILLPSEVEVGTWLGDEPAPWGNELVICCKNGVVQLSDGKLWPHDARLFVLNVIETEYHLEAQAPRWEQFLDELWRDDRDTRNALQEFFGLVLTDETKFQKGFIVVGPARSGKGTIARMLRHLLGANNYCGPSLGHFANIFGMQGLIGKKIAVVPDARLDNRANRSVITEKLLSILGEDPQEINRKNKPFWSGILRTRVMILSNELPDFKDDTGVIATRFIILQTFVSFLGREDTDLEAKLCNELSGILNWALAGWRELAARGKFSPLGDGELNEELANIASAIKAFVADCCELGPAFPRRSETYMTLIAFGAKIGAQSVGRIACQSINSLARFTLPSPAKSERSALRTTIPRANASSKVFGCERRGPHETPYVRMHI